MILSDSECPRCESANEHQQRFVKRWRLSTKVVRLPGHESVLLVTISAPTGTKSRRVSKPIRKTAEPRDEEKRISGGTFKHLVGATYMERERREISVDTCLDRRHRG